MDGTVMLTGDGPILTAIAGEASGLCEDTAPRGLPGRSDKIEKILADLRDFIDAHAAGDPAERTAHLHILNLDPIREALRSRWDAVEKKVVFLTESMLSGSLAKGEAYRYFGKNLFGVIYPSLTNAEGRVRIRAFAEKLCRKLLGDELESGRYGGDLVGKVLSLDALGNDDATTRERSRHLASARKKVLSEISVDYRPIWNPDTRCVDGYRASFCRNYNGRPIFGRHILHGGVTDPLWPDVYELMFTDILKQLRAGRSPAPYYIITLHIDTLMSKEFAAIAQDFLAKPGLRRNIRIEIVGVDDDVKISALKAAIELLRNSCDSVMVRLSPESLTTHELKLFGINSIGFNLFDLIQSGLGRRGSYVVAAHFAKKAHALGFDCYVWGVNAVQDFQIMTATKFKMLSGRAFDGDDGQTHSIYPLAPSLIVNTHQ